MAVMERRIERVETLARSLAGIDHDAAMAADPVQLAERAGISPDPWQRDVLRSDARRLILLCSRQSGKSTVASIRAVHLALYRPGALVLLLSPSLRQSQELFRKCLHAYQAAGRPVPADSETALTLTLSNGSRIVSLPGTEGKIRAFSGVALLIVDEASRVLDDLYMSVRPMLAVSGGCLMLTSTPWGRRGFFHAEWTEGGPGWERIRITARECPRIPREFLEEERRSMPPRWFNQEYQCSFEATEDQVFDYEDVMAALSPDVAPLLDLASPVDAATLDAPLLPLAG
jgi:hypothetical protein